MALTLLTVLTVLFLNPVAALANEEEGGHGLEMEVNGYHVTLSSEKDWVKGGNTVVVTLTDSMGMPVSNADVEIWIAPKVQEHAEEDSHGGESAHGSMPGMDMGEPEATAPSTHDEEVPEPVAMTESHEHGVYILETQLESSGEHEVQVFFHVNGEMLEADFIVDVSGMASKMVVLWSFLFINIGLIFSAGVLKNQTVTVKGK
jgi:hypothetical protein